jgi:hypothetical protein
VKNWTQNNARKASPDIILEDLARLPQLAPGYTPTPQELTNAGGGHTFLGCSDFSYKHLPKNVREKLGAGMITTMMVMMLMMMMMMTMMMMTMEMMEMMGMMHTHTHTQKYTHMLLLHTHTHAHTYIHAYMHTYIHTWT